MGNSEFDRAKKLAWQKMQKWLILIEKIEAQVCSLSPGRFPLYRRELSHISRILHSPKRA
jgi:hypothetical protein